MKQLCTYLGPNCSQRLSTDDTSRQIVYVGVVSRKLNSYLSLCFDVSVVVGVFFSEKGLAKFMFLFLSFFDNVRIAQ